MTRDDPNSDDPGPGLDFDRADFGENTETQLHCGNCGNPVSDAYFTLNDACVCARCEGLVREAGLPGSALARGAGAIAAGSLAAAVGGGLWLLITELTGYEIGLIAIAVGWMVGLAIQIGNRGVGGIPYQILAIFLCYSAIVMTYVPALVAEFEASWEDALVQGYEDGYAVGADETAEPAEAESPASEDTAIAEEEIELTPEERRVLMWVAVIPLAYMLPFLAGFENAIGILIIGFALWQAFQMTRKQPRVWGGPFQLGDGEAA